MNTLIDDLLLYSHVSRGASLEETVDLNQKVQLVLEDLEVVIAEKKASVTVENLPAIRGHRRQLQQLFQNLISNAIKYSKTGVPPEVHISGRTVNINEQNIPFNIESSGKQYVLFEVKDNGIGFSPEHAERIFNVFTRLHGRGEYAGSGVGLSIAEKVVQNHGGYIWAESTPGAGAKFSVLLPLQ
jgi:signal transduction histidine kinase